MGISEPFPFPNSPAARFLEIKMELLFEAGQVLVLAALS